MKESQKTILEQYLCLSDKPTLREISAETGIQMTRVFRLMNGSAMKLEEYEVFSNLVQKKMGLECALPALAQDCLKKLSPEILKELESVMRRKLALWDLKQKSKTFWARQTLL